MKTLYHQVCNDIDVILFMLFLYFLYRYELRVRYLPKSFHELYAKDKVTFYYLYDQVGIILIANHNLFCSKGKEVGLSAFNNTLGDNLHEMTRPIFWEKIEKKKFNMLTEIFCQHANMVIT